MPHSRPEGLVFERTNGAFSLVMMGHPHAGLPYGTVPRLLLARLTTEAVRTGERELVLGDTLSRFMAQLDVIPASGGGALPGCATRCADCLPRRSRVRTTRRAPGRWQPSRSLIAPGCGGIRNNPIKRRCERKSSAAPSLWQRRDAMPSRTAKLLSLQHAHRGS
jgi:Plasmid encoded RepA protein